MTEKPSAPGLHVNENAQLTAIAREAAGVAARYLADVGAGPVEREYKANAHDIVTIHDLSLIHI